MKKTAPVTDNSTRNYGLDVLRCTAMIMVVILHFLDKGGILRSLSLMSLSDEGTFSAADTAAWLLEALCIVAVNLYMLMSGYLLYSTKFRLSRLLKLVAKVWLYSVIIGFAGIALGTCSEPVNTYFLLRLLLPVSMNTYWFMTAYIFFYLLVPVLGMAAKAMNRSQMKLLLAGLLFFHVIIKTVVPAQLTTDASGMDAMWYIVLYFVAVYIRRFPGKGRRAAVYFILYVVGALLIANEAFILREVYLRTGSLSYILNISYSYNHLLVLFASVSLFLAFLRLKISERAGKVFAFLGKYSLGVYLLHENLSIRYAWQPLLGCDKATTVISIIGISVFAGIIVFVTGVIIDWAGSNIFGFALGILKKAPVFKSLSAGILKADKVFSGADTSSDGDSNG